MIFDEKTVFSEDIKNPSKTRKNLEQKKGFKNLYIVAFREGSTKPEIYPTLQFKQKRFNPEAKGELYVAGVFTAETDALEMVRRLCEISTEIDDTLNFREAFNRYREESD